jgi:hypothetical protein
LQRLKPKVDFAGIGGTSKLVPCYKAPSGASFPQAVKLCLFKIATDSDVPWRGQKPERKIRTLISCEGSLPTEFARLACSIGWSILIREIETNNWGE